MEDLERVLAIVVDTSDSFQDAWSGVGYHQFQSVSENFFQGSLGANNRLYLCQMSGDHQPVLWAGHPSAVKRTFPEADDFSQLLENQRKAHPPYGSPVYQSIADTIDTVMYAEGVREETQLAIVVFSDLEEYGTSATDRGSQSRRLGRLIKQYTASGGWLGIYGASQQRQTIWKRVLRREGVDESKLVIETNSVRTPRLPRFE